MGWGLVRAPLLPVESYPEGAPDDSKGATLLPEQLPVRAALAVGSQHLFAALKRTAGGAPDAPRLRRKLLRYLIRMTTRPTPYGLFAGVGLIGWGPATDIALEALPLRTRTRLDMGWLLELVAELERDPDVRRHLRLFANPLALSRAGRVFLCERTEEWERGVPARAVSIRATVAVQRVLARAKTPAVHAELAAELLSIPNATRAKIDKLIDELWQQSFLLTDLRPPLTGVNPGRYVCDRLSAINVQPGVQKRLRELLHALEYWDTLPVEERVGSWATLTKQTAGLHQPSASSVAVQVDLALALGGTRVHPDVAKEAARAAELLLRMTRRPNGPPLLHAYRTRFETRYGSAREVPLLELLDPQFGLGRHDGEDHTRNSLEPARDALRERTLSGLALDALRERRLVVELDDALLSRLETCSPTPDTAPRSLEISVFVAAASPAAIDAGDFSVVVGPNLGADSAGRGLGRFADLLGAQATTALEAVAQQEDPDGERLPAELVYLPWRARSANVAIRPAVVDYEILCGTTPGCPPDRVIPLQELVVGVHHERFYIRWPAANAEIAISEKHMLNRLHAPPVVRFLRDVQRDGRVVFDRFGWGPASEFAFLPRVQRGRAVLALAQWRVDGTGELAGGQREFQRALDDWRERWLVPRYVYLADADQRLLLDLESEAHGELLREELRRGPEGRVTVIQEALPGPADAWLPGPDGRYIVELVVPLAPRRRRQARLAVAPVTATRAASSSVRLRPPGSDWLFLKLYCPPALQDELIADDLAPFAGFAESAALADRWFFVRYVDTGAHLRVRFHGAPEVLVSRLLPQTCQWAAGLVADGSCFGFGFDTYEREVERYGGEVGVALAEELFAVDSHAVTSILRACADLPALDRITIAVLSVDTLLDGLGMGPADRLSWYRTNTSLSRPEGPEYRRRQEQLRQLLAHWPAAQEYGDTLGRSLETRRRALEPIVARLDDLLRTGQLGMAKAELCASYVHMHCNRLLGTQRRTETLVLHLARRTRESLTRAPASVRRTVFRY